MDEQFDLCFGSPPYLSARLYLEDGVDLGIARDFEAWVAWMLRVTAECLRVTRGPVVWVAAGITRGRNYQPACEALMADWHRRGGDCHMYRPCYWHRVGIPGSGQNDWFRSDVEYVMCFKRPGELPWSDNTAMGHEPRCAEGGDFSNRRRDGARAGIKFDKLTNHNGTSGRNLNDRPSHVRYQTEGFIANPGNLISTGAGGGGSLGSGLAHESEAPFPERLAEHFIRSLCPPGGLCLDPFSGSGTTATVSRRWNRRAVGLDLRQSQCQLGRRRLATDTPMLPTMV